MKILLPYYRIITLIFSLSFIIPSDLSGQTWLQTKGLNGKIIKTFTEFSDNTGNTNIFAGAINGGVYLSTNNGSSWTQVNNGLTDTVVYALATGPNGADGTNMFAGTVNDGVYLSTNNGSSWTQVNNGLTNLDINALAVNGNNLFAGTWGNGIFRSTNNGSNWRQVNDGLTDDYINTFVASPNGLGSASGETNLFAGTLSGGIFLSTNNGLNWTEVNNGLTNKNVLSLAVDSAGSNPIGAGAINLFAGTNGGGVFLSTNNGSSWTQVNYGLTNLTVQSLAVSYTAGGGTCLFAGTNGGGVFLSTNNGSSWIQVNNGLTNMEVLALTICSDEASSTGTGETNLFAGTNGSGILLVSTANLQITTTIATTSATNITLNSATLNGVVNPNGLSCIVQFEYGTTSSYGTTVTAPQSPVTGSSNVNVSANLTGLIQNTLYHFRVKATNVNGTSYGADSIFTTFPIWQQANGLYGKTITAFAVSPTGAGGYNLFAGTWGNGVYLSANNGLGWTQVGNGLADPVITALAVNPNGSDSKGTSGYNLFAATAAKGIYLSTNNGSSWVRVADIFTYQMVSALAVFSNGAGSTDTGSTGTSTTSGGTNIIAGIYFGGVYLSTNNGSNWIEANNGLIDNEEVAYFQVNAFAVYSNETGGNNLLVGVHPFLSDPGGVYISTNNGSSWTQINNGLTNTSVNAFAVIPEEQSSIGAGSSGAGSASSGTKLFAGTINGVFLSTNNGSNWTQVNNGLANVDVNTLLGRPTGAGGYYLFAGTNNGVYFSTNDGSSWTQVNSGLTNLNIRALAVVSNGNGGANLFAGTYGSGVFWASIADLKNTAAISTNDATNITTTSATLNGIINPNGLNSTVQFDYGTSINYGTTVTAIQSPVTGNSSVNVSANLTGLTPKRFYHYRVKSTNSEGTIYGTDRLFKTNFSYPSSISLTQSYIFKDPTKTSNFKLIGLPGNLNIPVTELLTGTPKQNWDAYSDNGDTSNYLKEFDNSSTFRFKPGNGFWITSKNNIDISQNVSTVQLNPDTSYSIALHSGWNIISNPFPISLVWDSIITANSLSSNSIIYGWNDGWVTPASFDPYEGYYFYNRQNLSSLKLPYNSDAVTGNTQSEPGVYNTNDGTKSLRLSLGAGVEEKSFDIISIDSTSSNAFDSKDILVPRGDFEDIGMTIYNQKLPTGYNNLLKESRSMAGSGQAFDIHITNKQEAQVTLTLEGVNNFKEYEVYLLDLFSTKLYNINESNPVVINPSREARFQILIGDDNFIQTAQKEILPTAYMLYQNYPNPFNPATTIIYSLPKSGLVTIEIYDILGREIKMLVNEQKPAGNYSVIFNASGLSSGVYLYRIQAGNFVETKKLLLLK